MNDPSGHVPVPEAEIRALSVAPPRARQVPCAP